MQTAAAVKLQSGAKGNNKLSALEKSSYKGMGRGIQGHCRGLQGIAQIKSGHCAELPGIM